MSHINIRIFDRMDYNELKKNEKINLPTVGPGPMTASAVITDCGIYEKQMTFLNAPLDQLKDV